LGRTIGDNILDVTTDIEGLNAKTVKPMADSSMLDDLKTKSDNLNTKIDDINTKTIKPTVDSSAIDDLKTKLDDINE
jgi:hypothetical protein